MNRAGLPQVSIDSTPLHEIDADALIFGFAKGADTAAPWTEFDAQLDGVLAESLASPAFRGTTGSALGVPLRSHRPGDLVLCGLGAAEEIDLDAWRQAIGRGVRVARERGAKRVAVAIPADSSLGADDITAAAAEASILGAYRYTEFKAPTAADGELDSVVIATSPSASAAVEHAGVVARAACWARDLINTSPSDKRPPRFAEIAREMAADCGLDCEVVDEDGARNLGLRALLAVGTGSEAGPRLVLLQHCPAGVEGPPVLLVGKGVTFDTGGISIKPSARMEEMKADMSGAAAVLATMRAVAELDLPLQVCAAVPMAENMPSGAAYRPGDLVRAYSGKTIEVLNTDAEGRMILADALAYGRERFEPGWVVDLATLTGACVVALGNDVAGLMGNDDELAAQLDQAGRESGEIVWRLPMLPAYRKLIESQVADIKNTGGRWGGAITAAKFLEEFVGDTPWAHLDIAGPAFATEDAAYRPRGGVGFGVRLLVRWLSARAGA